MKMKQKIINAISENTCEIDHYCNDGVLRDIKDIITSQTLAIKDLSASMEIMTSVIDKLQSRVADLENGEKDEFIF
ncbi:hypothetical protein BKH41_09345 [Helicobacter sp. 12S02232-10]|uniref:hypothetical protein n=1 Tax=Helicobacter sp. 12S02232-10 TaxID=1476197 RepID=UPI000BA76810|nr:hypothetical protein [Helicobacter sp. 12S02232-10]PAF46302.1 hypothetical protein BKH41_09345 [Helicobacter sp. 12S02232-10]